MDFYCGQSFINNFESINSKVKYYPCFENHFSKRILGHANLINIDRSLRVDGNKHVKKARVSNCFGQGKSYGFRIVFIVTPEKAIFLACYPKYGTLADSFSSIGIKEANELLKEYINESPKFRITKKGSKIVFESIVDEVPA